MADITPQMVKELREKTGAGMGDCKKALVETNGAIKEAIEYLRKKGAASLAKRQDRSANEGLVVAKTTDDGKAAAIVEINCETDFVAKNEEFGNFSNLVVTVILENNPSSIEELMNLNIGNDTVCGMYNEILAKYSEKIEIRRFEKINTDGFIIDYTHAGSKLAVLLEISESNPPEAALDLIKDLSMQIAAMNPGYIDRSVVPQAELEKEKEIYREAAIAEGKKEEIADKIALGRLNKFYQEQCLVEQQFVKDSSKSVADVLKDISKEFGKEVKVKRFIRYFLGESLESE
jgi:elongation factor Ts